MSGPTLAGAAVSRATLRIPRWGAWSADVTLADSPALTVGQRVDLVIGDLALRGTLRPGGDFGGTSTWTVIGGAGRWDTAVLARGDRDDGLVMLSQAARDLALAAQEDGIIVSADRPLGYAWTRPAGLASDALRALAGEAWWVAPDGVTHIGPRPSSQVAPSTLTVQRFDRSTLRASCLLADDALAQLLPGATATAPGLPAPLTVGSLVAHVEDGSITVDLFGERDAAQLLAAIVDALTQWRRFLAAYPCTVTEVAGQRASVEPRDARADGLELGRYLDPVQGVPGLTVQLQPGAGVLVGFLGGDPASPAIVGHLPGTLPAAVGLDAAAITLGGAAAKKLVQIDELNAILSVISARLVAIDHGAALAPVTGTAKVKAE